MLRLNLTNLNLASVATAVRTVTSVAAIAAIASIGGVGCATYDAAAPSKTTRLIEGKATNTRYISPEAYDNYLQAELYISEQKWPEAIRHLELALIFDEQSAYLHQTLADVFLRVGNISEADKHINRAIELGSKNDPGLRELKSKVQRP